MRKHLKSIAAIMLFWAIIIYLIASFVNWDFNIGVIDKGERVTWAIIFIAPTFIHIIIYVLEQYDRG